jgi:hypothetical protein
MWLADNQHSIADDDQTSQSCQAGIKVVWRDIVGRRKHNLPIVFLVNPIDIFLPYTLKRPLACRELFESDGHFLGVTIPAVM